MLISIFKWFKWTIVESGPIREEHTRASRTGRCHIRLKPNLNGFLYKLPPPPAFHHQIQITLLSLCLSYFYFLFIIFWLLKLLKSLKLSLLKVPRNAPCSVLSVFVSSKSLATATPANRSMAFEQYFSREWKSIAGAATGSDNYNGCFDCNICLDFAYEPVVTLCGHLYCWPCIYKWLHIQSASLSSDEPPQCPVCKADISHTQMVPLYGRGQTPTESEVPGKAPIRGMAIPPRPPACANQSLQSPTSNSAQQLPYRNPYQNQHNNPYPYGGLEEDSPSLLNLGGTGMTGFHHPVVGMFGEMVYARVFGNSESLYTYPNSNHLVGSSNPRLRRQEMQVDKSLNRISIFLFCCFLLCLIVF